MPNKLKCPILKEKGGLCEPRKEYYYVDSIPRIILVGKYKGINNLLKINILIS
jgi:hypothetical protein